MDYRLAALYSMVFYYLVGVVCKLMLPLKDKVLFDSKNLLAIALGIEEGVNIKHCDNIKVWSKLLLHTHMIQENDEQFNSCWICECLTFYVGTMNALIFITQSFRILFVHCLATWIMNYEWKNLYIDDNNQDNLKLVYNLINNNWMNIEKVL